MWFFMVSFILSFTSLYLNTSKIDFLFIQILIQLDWKDFFLLSLYSFLFRNIGVWERVAWCCCAYIHSSLSLSLRWTSAINRANPPRLRRRKAKEHWNPQPDLSEPVRQEALVRYTKVSISPPLYKVLSSLWSFKRWESRSSQHRERGDTVQRHRRLHVHLLALAAHRDHLDAQGHLHRVWQILRPPRHLHDRHI